MLQFLFSYASVSEDFTPWTFFLQRRTLEFLHPETHRTELQLLASGNCLVRFNIFKNTLRNSESFWWTCVTVNFIPFYNRAYSTDCKRGLLSIVVIITTSYLRDSSELWRLLNLKHRTCWGPLQEMFLTLSLLTTFNDKKWQNKDINLMLRNQIHFKLKTYISNDFGK